jgi:hypothetical protein
MNQLTAQQLLVLARAHIRQFERKLEAAAQGYPYVNVEECRSYLALWNSVHDKAACADWPIALLDAVTSREAGEVADALADGSYDALLAAAGGS